MADLIEKELSYTIVGALFSVYNELGGGYQEKYYQRAIAQEFKKRNLNFMEQVMVPLNYGEQSIGRYFLDFVIENKIVLEIKAVNKFFLRDIKQILAYLQSTKMPLGILANFGRDNLQLKRILPGKRTEKIN